MKRTYWGRYYRADLKLEMWGRIDGVPIYQNRADYQTSGEFRPFFLVRDTAGKLHRRYIRGFAREYMDRNRRFDFTSTELWLEGVPDGWAVIEGHEHSIDRDRFRSGTEERYSEVMRILRQLEVNGGR